MFGNFRYMLMQILLFFAKMIFASKLKEWLIGLVNLTTTDRVRSIKEFKTLDIINLAFVMGILFTYINKFFIEKVLTRVFV